jgi:nucleotide-binding universal stress UspA family protein
LQYIADVSTQRSFQSDVLPNDVPSRRRSRRRSTAQVVQGKKRPVAAVRDAHIGIGPVLCRTSQKSVHAKFGEEGFLNDGRGHARLKELAEGIEASGGTVAETHFESGNPEVRIVTVAEEIGAGFVVMGKTGYGGLKRALIGSISDYVVRYSQSPVVVVGE